MGVAAALDMNDMRRTKFWVRPILESDLTGPQKATLAYVAQKCQITTTGHNSGSIPLKRLVEKGLMRKTDASWGSPLFVMMAWTPTMLGRMLLEHTGDYGATWLYEQGWQDYQ